MNGWGVALLTAVAGFVGSAFGTTADYWVHDREMNIKMVEIAVGILREEPKDNIRPAREWAVDVIQEYSEISVSPRARAALIENRIVMWDVNEFQRWLEIYKGTQKRAPEPTVPR